MEKKTKDFVFSFVLVALGIYVVVEGLGIYRYAASAPYNITDFTISPAFLPIILGFALIVCSVMLCFQSLKDGNGTIRTNWKKYWQEVKLWFKPAITNPDTISMAVGLVIIALYTFILLGRLPFWAASFIFLMALMGYLRADKVWKLVIITIAGVGAVYLLFQVAFKTSLP